MMLGRYLGFRRWERGRYVVQKRGEIWLRVDSRKRAFYSLEVGTLAQCGAASQAQSLKLLRPAFSQIRRKGNQENTVIGLREI
jgi:hypothetical protein